MHIVLHEPEIPHNTGAIGRTCLMTQSTLHLVRPYGFYLDEKSLKRSGLDYWHKLDVHEYANFHDFLDKNPNAQFFLVETGGSKTYADVEYRPDDFLVFGSETRGLPDWIMRTYPSRVVTIPMSGDGRSLNLSVAVGIVLYEALRQNGFASSHN